MKNKLVRSMLTLALTAAGAFSSAPALAEAFTSCTMTYKMSGWSLVYKQYDGIGNISCSNGQRAQVALASKSIGFTIGKSEIEGTGVFSDVKNLNEIYGNFVALEGHAGATKSVDGQVLTRGEISLALSGKGRGIDIGVTLGALTISPR
ncbi:hypothetical protein ACH518_18330 [Methylomonas sp. HW2-6]|uniref:hypothetical protein n=1 Tax=Methylomonas TaxID=416 RepID=UPI00112B0331|nr:hypothetical protein [Methylomonas koyamae]TPQ28494.1 hypothetical protein C2U68_04620 [Methylomonas koyamae]